MCDFVPTDRSAVKLRLDGGILLQDRLMILITLILKLLCECGIFDRQHLDASSAAFFAVLTPTVATGIPGGIMIVERSASMPSSTFDEHGIPITGSVVFAAMAPARCAAMPAAAMMTPKPFSRADFENCAASSGVLWALYT